MHSRLAAFVLSLHVTYHMYGSRVPEQQRTCPGEQHAGLWQEYHSHGMDTIPMAIVRVASASLSRTQTHGQHQSQYLPKHVESLVPDLTSKASTAATLHWVR